MVTSHNQVKHDLPLPSVPVSHATIDDLRAAIQQFEPDADFSVVEQAYNFARAAHEGQSRRSGEPYIQHPLEVALIVVRDVHLVNREALAAALLHDVIEDTPCTKEHIEKEFGTRIAELVDGLTKLEKSQFGEHSGVGSGPEVSAERQAEMVKEHQQAENMRKMFLAMAEDLRVVFIKLADRLHNMRTLAAQPAHKHKRIANQTLDIFAPLANRFGMSAIKNELEDLCFRYLEPETYAQVQSDLQRRKAGDDRYLAQMIAEIRSSLADIGIDVVVKGRSKHLFGVWRKMQRKNRPADEIYDVLGIRVIIPSEEGDLESSAVGKSSPGWRKCYTALGIIHSIWRPIIAEFDDYLGSPRNGIYRSLHTAVHGPDGRSVEIQIRTSNMHEEAEYGLAAHWRYKEDSPADEKLLDKIASLRRLIEWMKDVSSPSQFVEDFKSEAFQDYIYVFTPNGDVRELPAGSTPVDFAYHIHSDIGNHMIQAIVDGKTASFSTPLQNGQVVEVITNKVLRPGPTRDWLDESKNFVKSPSVRAKIKQWFRRQQRDENITEGKRILDAELRSLGLTRLSYEDIASYFSRTRFRTTDEFLAAIGYGEITGQMISDKFPKTVLDRAEGEQEEEAKEKISKLSLPSEEQGKLVIDGSRSIAWSPAHCCNPMPGDEVTAYSTKVSKITIHRADCVNVGGFDPDRLFKVEWGTHGQRYPVAVLINALDSSGVLHKITGIVSEEKVNIAMINTAREERRGTVSVTVTLEVSGVSQLRQVLARISAIKEVYSATRLTNEGGGSNRPPQPTTQRSSQRPSSTAPASPPPTPPARGGSLRSNTLRSSNQQRIIPNPPRSSRLRRPA